MLIENQQWDPMTPVAIVERASCLDQRVTRTILKYLSSVVEEIGSRPPGLIITGPAVMKLCDIQLTQFNEGHKYHIEEGFQDIDIDLSNLL